MPTNRRSAVILSAVLAASTFSVLPAIAQMGAPANSDNQMNGMNNNSQQNTNNNAGSATNNGGMLDNAANSASNTANNAENATRNKLDQAGAGTPTADNPAPDAKGIRKTIGKITTEALDKGDMDDLIGYFTDDAADRIKKSDTYSQSYGDKLDGRIEQIDQAWQQKYGHKFDVKKTNTLFGDQFATIQQGVVGQNADLTAAVAGEANSTKLENGRSIALVTIKQSNDLPELKVPMVHELPDSWRVNPPADLDAAKLRQNLTDHLTALGDHTDQWPADENDAYRVVAHHVFMAILDKPVAWNGSASPDTGNMGGMNMGK